MNQPKTVSAAPSHLGEDECLGLVVQCLEDAKGSDILQLSAGPNLPWKKLVLVTARSPRHARSVADKLRLLCKSNKMTLLGVEGFDNGEWVLFDMAEIVVHILLAEMREYYDLENLWGLLNPT